MKRLSLLAVAAAIALAGCNAGGATTSQSSLLSSASRPTAGSSLKPFSMPRYTGSMAQEIQSHTRADSAGNRQKKDSLGGLPTFGIDISLLDAPIFGAGAQVNLAVIGVQAVSNGTPYDIASYTSPVLINVLALQRAALPLGQSTLPAMHYDAIRMIVDPAQSNIVFNGNSLPMSFGFFESSSHAFTASGAPVANIDFPLSIDGTTGNQSFLIDFNAFESVAISGSGAQIGQTKAAAQETTAAVISGNVVNSSGSAVSGATVIAHNPDGSVAGSTQTANDGTFQIHALTAGTYSISVHNSYVTQAGTNVQASGVSNQNASQTLPASNIPAGYQLNVGTITN